ncbi:hypothetical protein D5047_21550 [Verminephrobacter eiseniae]|nr:hypothetical protein [Verminephrobacter eiseniae]
MPERLAMNTPLDMLRMGLIKLSAPVSFVNPADPTGGMKSAREKVEHDHGAAGIRPPPSETIISVIQRFRRTGAVESLRHLKYVCLGLGASIDPQGWCVFADAGLLRRVIDLVEKLPEMRRRMRCFQALLSSYWAFPFDGKQTSGVAQPNQAAGWRELRSWLRAEHGRSARSLEPKPSWFTALTKYEALLTDRPCEQFGAPLLCGDATELNDAVKSLAIPPDSWVQQEAIIAQMQAGCALDDGAFKARLSNLIAITTGHVGVELGPMLGRRCVALLVWRYALCSEHREHIALRDAAVAIVGNPWLHRTHWDAWVVDARGKPHDPSREMVNGWLKRRLIRDFFELLSADGMGDRRRVDYWLRWEPVIEDMWFVLGRDAQHRSREPFKDFKNRAKGRLLDLLDSTSDNNAFVMRVGRYLLVEFGAKGNAMFVFEWDLLDQSLRDTLEGRAQSVSIYSLKDNRGWRMIHYSPDWEQRFDADLHSLIGTCPGALPTGVAPVQHAPRPQAFSPAAWSLFAQTHGLRVQDLRNVQGALWVLGVEQPDAVVAQLNAWGFRRRDPKGWFKE